MTAWIGWKRSERFMITFMPAMKTFTVNTKTSFCKNLKVYHDANPLKLMKLLMRDGVDTDLTFILF